MQEILKKKFIARNLNVVFHGFGPVNTKKFVIEYKILIFLTFFDQKRSLVLFQCKQLLVPGFNF